MGGTWGEMSPEDRQACEDAGRGQPEDPKELADQARKERKERSDG